MRNRRIMFGPVAVLVIGAVLLAGCGKTVAPTTAPTTTASPATTGPAATTSPATTAPPATTRPAATTSSPTATPTTPALPANVAKVTLKKLDGTTVEKVLEKPRYGGTLSYIIADQAYFDNWFGPAAGTTSLTNENLVMYDWKRGLSGTGEFDFKTQVEWPATNFGMGLAESWEFIDSQTVLYHIRKGVKFALNPNSEAAILVNGRELTADDVAFSVRRLWTNPKGYGTLYYPGQAIPDEIKALDRYTVQVKFTPGNMQNSFTLVGTNAVIWPRDALEKYGGYLQDWQNSVGTGPFILTDYVKANSATLVRNPSYWLTDPYFPANALPYVDGVNLLIVTDSSTKMAALRTAKIDLLGDLGVDDYQSLIKTNPELKSVEFPGNAPMISWRVDKSELPFYDKRVRQALSMAIDRQAMKEQLYSGHAEIAEWPVKNVPQFNDMYTPITSLPESIRQLYEYHPDKAKQLLADAGYPNGFKTEVLAIQADVDLLSVVQFYWAKIGVDLTLDVKEAGLVSSIKFKKTHNAITVSAHLMDFPFRLNAIRPKHVSNTSIIDDPKASELIAAVNAAWPDPSKQAPIIKAALPYIYEQSWWLSTPAPNGFVMWWPWLANYAGEIYSAMRDNVYGAKYLWIDQDLKKAMGR